MELPDSGPGSLAGIGARALQRFSDFFLSALVPWVVLGGLFVETAEDAEGTITAVSVPLWLPPVLLGILIAYEIGFVAWKGRTIGMLAGRLRLARFDKESGELLDPDLILPDHDADPNPVEEASAPGGITPRVAVRRALPAVVLFSGSLLIPIFALFYLVLYVSPILDPLYKQGWHDKLAGTVVVRA